MSKALAFSSSRQISLAELRWLRMGSQSLFPRRPKGNVLAVIHSLLGVNAQLPSAMYLSLRARVEGITKEEIDDLRISQRLTVRTWCMRDTMHLLAARDVAWLLSMLPASLVEDGWRWLERRAGLPRVLARQILDEAWQTLKVNGPLTRSELVQALIPQYGQQAKSAAAGIVHLNGLLGRVCFGPDRGADPTYVAMEDWLSPSLILPCAENFGELALHYLRGYGPVSVQDFAAWWGSTLSDAKKAWSQMNDELIYCNFDGQPLCMTGEPSADLGSPDPVVRLLPAFDNYYLGYRVRDFAVPIEHQPRVFHGGEIVPVILLDGSAVGTWHYERRGRQMRILARPFTDFVHPIRELIAEEAADIGRFYQLKPVLSFQKVW